MDSEKTQVIFRKFKDGDIIALFPYLTERYQTPSYMHVGQHSDADYQCVMQTTKPAKPNEYNDLFNELTSIGYNLQIMQKACYRKMYKF